MVASAGSGRGRGRGWTGLSGVCAGPREGGAPPPDPPDPLGRTVSRIVPLQGEIPGVPLESAGQGDPGRQGRAARSGALRLRGGGGGRLTKTRRLPRIVLASDHGGVAMKADLLRFLSGKGYVVRGLGRDTPHPVDYPDYEFDV